MRHALILAFAAILSVAAPAVAQNLSPESALKVTHETLMQAVAGANVQRISTMIHPQAIGFFRSSQRVTQIQGADLPSVIQGILTDMGEFTTSQSPLDTIFRVVGETGIVTQTAVREAVVSKRKVTLYLRTTTVYVHDAAGWKLLSWHTSDSPLQK